MSNLTTWTTSTGDGRTLSLFYNRESKLLVVDVIDADEKGGVEIVRMTLPAYHPPTIRSKVNKSRREEGEFVPLSLLQAHCLSHGDEVYLRPARGGDTLLRCRVSSRVKLWKRDPDRFEVAVKHGMYDNARLDNSDLPRMFRKVGP